MLKGPLRGVRALGNRSKPVYLSVMATMISEVYDALIAAGAPEDKARKAAEAPAMYENRFAKVDSDLLQLKLISGFNTAIGIGILLKLFVH